MYESFIITIVHEGEETEFKARFERWGYTHRIAVLINEATITFEPDEEGGYRALADSQQVTAAGVADIKLLQNIAEKLSKLSAT